MLSINSFNSSMNFAKLQSQINQRSTLQYSENGSKNMIKTSNLGSNQLPVKEACPEDEQSDDQQRFSCQSLISMMDQGKP